MYMCVYLYVIAVGNGGVSQSPGKYCVLLIFFCELYGLTWKIKWLKCDLWCVLSSNYRFLVLCSCVCVCTGGCGRHWDEAPVGLEGSVEASPQWCGDGMPRWRAWPGGHTYIIHSNSIAMYFIASEHNVWPVGGGVQIWTDCLLLGPYTLVMILILVPMLQPFFEASFDVVMFAILGFVCVFIKDSYHNSTKTSIWHMLENLIWLSAPW